MILTVTCNPAIDVTYAVDRLSPGQVHRVRDVRRVPGGKGVNVARVAHQLGHRVVATGLGDAEFGDRLSALGIESRFVHGLGGVRQTLVVHDERGATSLWEPGCTPRPGATDDLVDAVMTLLPEASALVISGSLPPGVDPGLPAVLAAAARSAGVPALLDLDGDPLLRAAKGTGAVLTPNREEFARLTGLGPEADIGAVTAAAAQLSRQTHAPVVVTLGAKGLVASTGTQAWRVRPLQELFGNATGAGDAAAAAIAVGISAGQEWPTVLVEAVAASAAAVMVPVAGQLDLPTYHAWRRQLTVERLTAPARNER